MRQLITTEQLTARDRILGAARALLSGELDVLHAAAQIAGFAHVVDPKYEDVDLRAFVGIASETDVYLLGGVWPPDVREAREAEYKAANEAYTARGRAAAERVVQKLTPPA